MTTIPVRVFDGVAFLATGDLLLTLWQSPARVERIRTVTRWTEDAFSASSGTIAGCQFLLPSASPPNREAYADAKIGLKLVESRARRLITVPLGDAAWQGIVRSIIRAVVSITGRARVIKVASTERQAFDWLAEVATPNTPGGADLETAVDSLYAGLGIAVPHRQPPPSASRNR